MPERKTILFIGHSLIEYYGWDKRFPAHDVRNLGVAGETTGELLVRTGRITAAHPGADIIFLMSGINDVAIENPGFVDEYRQVVRELSAAYPGARIYVNAILPVVLEWVPVDEIKKINRSLRELAAAEGARFLDLFSLFTNDDGNPREELLLEDGVHLSDRGYEVWSAAVEHELDVGSF